MTDSGRPRAIASYAGVAVLVVPAALVIVLAALLRTRLPVRWEDMLLAAALYSLGTWIVYQILRALAGGRWREMLLAGVSLAAAIAAGEVALRRLRPYDSLCRFRWIASSRYHHVNPAGRTMFSGFVEGAPVVVQTNEDGFRTRHSREAFQRHPVRVAVLGDSFVFGSGVDGESAFPARLERRLRSRAATSGAAVLNAGVISYSPFLERRLFEDVVARYRPTLVLLFLDVTDIGDDAIYARKAGEQGIFPLEGDERFVCHGAVHQLLRPYADRVKAQALYPVHLLGAALGRPPRPPANYYVDPVMFRGQPENRYFIYRHPLDQTEPFFRETLRNVEAVASAARRGGARFILVVFPRYHHWSARECPDNWERGAYTEDEPYQYEHFRFFAAAAPTAGFPTLDLLPAFRATSEFPLVFRHDPHWNARGHEFVAQRVEEYLLAGGLVP